MGLSSGTKPKDTPSAPAKREIISSSIERVNYDRSSKKLSVVFRSNKPGEKSKVYEYLNVSPRSWNEVQKSDSLGRAINKIKQRHNVKFDGKIRKLKKSSLSSGINDSERSAASDGFPKNWFEDVSSSRQKEFLEEFIQKNPSLDQGGKFINDFLDGDEKATEMVSEFAENKILEEISKSISGARGTELNQRMNEFEDKIKQNKKKEKKAVNDWLNNIGKKNKLSSGTLGRGGRLGSRPDDKEYRRERQRQIEKDRADGENATNPVGKPTASEPRKPPKPPRAAKLMAVDTKNSNLAKKITYDPDNGDLTVTYNDGKVENFDEVMYDRVYKAGFDDDPDKLIRELLSDKNQNSSKLSSGRKLSSGAKKKNVKVPFPEAKPKRVSKQQRDDEKIYKRRNDGESLADVAESLGISRMDVRKREQRHMRRLREEEGERLSEDSNRSGEKLSSGKKRWVELANEEAGNNPKDLANFLIEKDVLDEDHPMIKKLRDNRTNDAEYEKAFEMLATLDEEDRLDEYDYSEAEKYDFRAARAARQGKGKLSFGGKWDGKKPTDKDIKPGTDLSGADLRDRNLYGADLTEVNLSGANLDGAYLFEADLRNADLSGARMDSAFLEGAKLTGANLTGADLTVANLRLADLSNANLFEANLTQADLSKAKLSGANLRRANLFAADLRLTDLRNANLSGANLRGANLASADMDGANLRGADMDKKLSSGLKKPKTFREMMTESDRLRAQGIMSDSSLFDDEWQKTEYGIEINAPDIDGSYEIQGNAKDGFIVSRISDAVRNGGQDAKEYEHDKVFKSRAAAKKWAVRDYKLMSEEVGGGDVVEEEVDAKRKGKKRTSINETMSELQDIVDSFEGGVPRSLSSGRKAEDNVFLLQETIAKDVNKFYEGNHNGRDVARHVSGEQKKFVKDNVQELEARRLHEAMADMWVKEGHGWTTHQWYPADKYKSPDYLRGVELGINQARDKWTGDDMRSRPKDFNEKQKAGVAYNQWYQSYVRSLGAYLDAMSQGEDSAFKQGIEQAIREDVYGKRPDVGSWEKTSIDSLSEVVRQAGFTSTPESPKKEKERLDKAKERRLRGVGSYNSLSSGKNNTKTKTSPLDGMKEGTRLSSGKLDEVYKSISAKLIKAIEEADGDKWEAPWYKNNAFPKNPTNNNRPYSNTNLLFLMFAQEEKGYTKPLWATYKQWEKAGGQVRRGEKGTGILVPRVFKGKEDADGNKKAGGVYYTVATLFNVDQIDGVDVAKLEEDIPKLSESQRITQLETAIKEIGAKITEATQGSAFYRPSTDEIVMPRFEDFKSPLDFYATQAHEMMHWTGHTSRLNRPNMNAFGTEAYAYEELVAEIASAFFMAAHGLSAEPQPQHAKYLASWLKRLKSDPDALQKAVQDAQKATNFAINLSPSMRKQIAISDNVDDVPGVTIPFKTGDVSTGKLSSGKNWDNPDTQKRLIDFAKSKPKTKKNGEESFFASVVRQFESRGKLYDSQWAKLDEISPSGETPKPKSTTKLATKFSNKPRKITELEDIEEYDYPKLPENRKPTVEQGAAIDAMMTGEDTKIGALAATGKTTTVINFADRLLDKEPESRILYLVFNVNARDEAEKRGMPGNVNVMTMDALSFRAMRVAQPEMTKKSFKQMPGHILPLRSFIDRASYLGVKGTVSQGNDLSAADVYRRVSKAVDAYAISADEKIGPQHFNGAFNGKLKVEDEALIPELIEYANKMWQDMNMPRVSASGGKKGQGMLPISNTHITKMWALTKPDIGLSAEVNVAMVDEAQDMNPVFADLLRGGKNLQRIYIGDTNQAINAWRGADGKTLDEAYAKYDMPLTDSFRYGKEIAGMGNRFLSLLGRKERMTGLKKDKNGNPLDGKIGPIDNPTMILARSNGGAITATMEVFERGGTVFGSKNFKEDLSSFIDNLEFLETGSGGNRPYYTASTGTRIYDAPKDSTDLDGITTYVDFEKAIARADNNRLNMLGKLTEQYSYSTLRDSLNRIITDKSKLPKNRDEYIHIQTAHTSKGLESPRVQIWSDFQKPKFDQESKSWILPDEQELRLSYVAVTRAEEELDLGSLQWITERTSDADGASKKLSSGGRLARRVNDNDKVTSKNRTTSSDVAKLSSGKKKSRKAKRKPFSAEDRQAVADGNRLRAQTIPGKRKQGPSIDEFGLSSGGGSRVYRRRESIERMSSGRGSEPKYLPITQGEKGTAAKIRERFKTPALVGSVSDNKTRKADGPWMLEFSKFLPYLVFAGDDGKSRKEPTSQNLAELLNITDPDAKKLLKPGGAISEAAAADIFAIINPGTSSDTMSKVDDWLDGARKIWGFDSAPYWYDYYDVRKNSNDKPKLLTREEFDLMEESSFENNDVEAYFDPIDMPDSDRSDDAKTPETTRPTDNRRKIETSDEKRSNFSYDKLLEFFGLEDASNEEIFEAFSVTNEDGTKIMPTVNQIRNWKQNGVPTAFILKLKEDGVIPSANNVFGSDASQELDKAVPQNKFYRALDNLLRENSIQLNNTEIGQIVGDVVNNGRPVTKLNSAFKLAQENAPSKFSFLLGKAVVWSDKEIEAVIEGISKKTGKKLSASDLKLSSGKSGIGVRRINPKITKQSVEGRSGRESLSSGRGGLPFPRLTGVLSRAKMSASGVYSEQLKLNKKNNTRRSHPSLAKLSSGSKSQSLSSKDKSELIYWARNKGNWSNFAKSLLTQFGKTGQLSATQWSRLLQLHDNSVKRR